MSTGPLSIEEVAGKLSNELKVKECPAFVGCMNKQTKGPRFLCINDAEMPLTSDGFGDKKQVTVGLTVVTCLDSGFTRVPMEHTSGNKYKVCMHAT